MQSDFSDIRFTQSDGTTLVDGWLESKVDDTSAETWVEFPTTPANTVEQTYYMYYGKADAVSDWDGAATFIDYDIFDNLTDWVGGTLVTSPVYNGTNSNRFTYGSGTTHVVSNGAQIISVMFYDNGGSSMQNILSHGVVVSGANKNHLAGVVTSSSNDFYWKRYDATWGNTGVSRSVGWHEFKFVMTGSAQSIYIDDNLVDGPRSYDTGTESGYNFVGADWWSGTDGYSYIDQYIVRKYAANPPTYAFGAEESAPFISQIIIF